MCGQGSAVLVIPVLQIKPMLSDLILFCGSFVESEVKFALKTFILVCCCCFVVLWYVCG